MSSKSKSNGKKQKYRIFAKSTDILYADIWATDIDEAESIAEDLDGGNFVVDSYDWEYLEVVPLKDSEHPLHGRLHHQTH